MISVALNELIGFVEVLCGFNVGSLALRSWLKCEGFAWDLEACVVWYTHSKIEDCFVIDLRWDSVEALFSALLAAAAAAATLHLSKFMKTEVAKPHDTHVFSNVADCSTPKDL